MDELFEALTLMQTEKIKKQPIVLYDSSFWTGLLDWFQTVMAERYQTISPDDHKLFYMADSPEQVVKAIEDFHVQNKLRPNF